MDEPDLDDRHIDQHILAARAGTAGISERVSEGRLDEAVAMFRSIRVQHIQPISDELPVQLVENYAQVGRQLAKRLQADAAHVRVSSEVWDAVGKAYDWLARRTPMAAAYGAFAADARLQAGAALRPTESQVER